MKKIVERSLVKKIWVSFLIIGFSVIWFPFGVIGRMLDFATDDEFSKSMRGVWLK